MAPSEEIVVAVKVKAAYAVAAPKMKSEHTAVSSTTLSVVRSEYIYRTNVFAKASDGRCGPRPRGDD